MASSSRLWVLALPLALALAVAGCGRRPPERPNIVLLIADDQRTDTIGAWGNPHIRTPNLDRLAERGFSFRAAYNLGSNTGAVCIPSRAMLHTGRAYFRVPNNLEGVKILPELLREAGYVTFAPGKWHNERPSFLRGFAGGQAVFFGGMSDHTRVPVEDLSEDGRLVNARMAEGFSSELFADAAIEFLRRHRSGRPFFAYVAFTAPHDPRQPPEAFLRPYYEQRPPLPPNFLPQHPFNNGHLGGRDENLAAWPRTAEVIRDQLAEYYGMITHLDEQVGRILAALEESGHASHTYVIYTADNGLALGSHGLLGKQNLYEHSQRVPLIIAGPGLGRGSTEALVYLHDLFPTILGLARLTAPADLDGADLAPIWRGEKQRVRDSLFLSFTNLMRAVRDERYKLIRYPQINYTQLFDLDEDPHELRNLAEAPELAGRRDEMLSLVAEWQRRLGDAQPLSTDKPQPKRIDMTGAERKPDPWQPAWIVKKYF